jgi:hypothetical protein
MAETEAKDSHLKFLNSCLVGACLLIKLQLRVFTVKEAHTAFPLIPSVPGGKIISTALKSQTMGSREK